MGVGLPVGGIWFQRGHTTNQSDENINYTKLKFCVYYH